MPNQSSLFGEEDLPPTKAASANKESSAPITSTASPNAQLGARMRPRAR